MSTEEDILYRPIEGKIAEVLDYITVVINKGLNDGVENGMRFIIYRRGGEIIDPDSKESLGYFEHIKSKVRVVHVNERFSTAISDETETITENMFNLPNFGPRTRKVPKSLPLDESITKKFGEPEIDTIKIGDLVKEIVD